MRNLIDKIKRYFGFSKAEVQELLVTILILGFVFGFNDKREQFNMALWAVNFFHSLLLVALALLVQQSALRVFSLLNGYRAEYKMFFYGLLSCLVISLITYGKVIFFLPGHFVVNILEGHRIGGFRYGINKRTLGWISLVGPISNMVLAIMFKGLTYIPALTDNFLIERAIAVNMLFALYSMLPIPNSIGMYTYSWNPLGLAYTLSAFIGLAIMIQFNINILIIILVAAIVGGIGWLLYYIYIGRGGWKYVDDLI